MRRLSGPRLTLSARARHPLRILHRMPGRKHRRLSGVLLNEGFPVPQSSQPSKYVADANAVPTAGLSGMMVNQSWVRPPFRSGMGFDFSVQGITDWAKANPVLAAGAGLGLFLILSGGRRR